MQDPSGSYLLVTEEDLVEDLPMSIASLRTTQAQQDVPTKQTNFQCPVPLRNYVAEVAQAQRRSQATVIVQALELDRDLGAKLVDRQERLQAFAQTHGLSLDTQLAEVLAQLVRRGLDGLEHEKKAKK